MARPLIWQPLAQKVTLRADSEAPAAALARALRDLGQGGVRAVTLVARQGGRLMRAAVEFAGFGVAAVAVHLAAFAAIAPDGMDAGGDGGAGAVTVAAPLGAADPALSAMVRDWEAPVQVMARQRWSPRPRPESAPDALPELRRDGLPELPGLAAPQAAPVPTVEPPRFAQTVRASPTRRLKPARARALTPRPRPAPRPARPRNAPAAKGRAAQRGQGAAQVQSGGGNSASALAEWGGRIRAAVARAQTRPGTARARCGAGASVGDGSGGSWRGVSHCGQFRQLRAGPSRR